MAHNPTSLPVPFATDVSNHIWEISNGEPVPLPLYESSTQRQFQIFERFSSNLAESTKGRVHTIFSNPENELISTKRDDLNSTVAAASAAVRSKFQVDLQLASAFFRELSVVAQVLLKSNEQLKLQQQHLTSTTSTSTTSSTTAPQTHNLSNSAIDHHQELFTLQKIYAPMTQQQNTVISAFPQNSLWDSTVSLPQQIQQQMNAYQNAKQQGTEDDLRTWLPAHILLQHSSLQNGGDDTTNMDTHQENDDNATKDDGDDGDGDGDDIYARYDQDGNKLPPILLKNIIMPPFPANMDVAEISLLRAAVYRRMSLLVQPQRSLYAAYTEQTTLATQNALFFRHLATLQATAYPLLFNIHNASIASFFSITQHQQISNHYRFHTSVQHSLLSQEPSIAQTYHAFGQQFQDILRILPDPEMHTPMTSLFSHMAVPSFAPILSTLYPQISPGIFHYRQGIYTFEHLLATNNHSIFSQSQQQSQQSQPQRSKHHHHHHHHNPQNAAMKTTTFNPSSTIATGRASPVVLSSDAQQVLHNTICFLQQLPALISPSVQTLISPSNLLSSAKNIQKSFLGYPICQGYPMHAYFVQQEQKQREHEQKQRELANKTQLLQQVDNKDVVTENSSSTSVSPVVIEQISSSFPTKLLPKLPISQRITIQIAIVMQQYQQKLDESAHPLALSEHIAHTNRSDVTNQLLQRLREEVSLFHRGSSSIFGKDNTSSMLIPDVVVTNYVDFVHISFTGQIYDKLQAISSSSSLSNPGATAHEGLIHGFVLWWSRAQLTFLDENALTGLNSLCAVRQQQNNFKSNSENLSTDMYTAIVTPQNTIDCCDSSTLPSKHAQTWLQMEISRLFIILHYFIAAEMHHHNHSLSQLSIIDRLNLQPYASLLICREQLLLPAFTPSQIPTITSTTTSSTSQTSTANASGSATSTANSSTPAVTTQDGSDKQKSSTSEQDVTQTTSPAIRLGPQHLANQQVALQRLATQFASCISKQRAFGHSLTATHAAVSLTQSTALGGNTNTYTTSGFHGPAVVSICGQDQNNARLRSNIPAMLLTQDSILGQNTTHPLTSVHNAIGPSAIECDIPGSFLLLIIIYCKDLSQWVLLHHQAQLLHASLCVPWNAQLRRQQHHIDTIHRNAQQQRYYSNSGLYNRSNPHYPHVQASILLHTQHLHGYRQQQQHNRLSLQWVLHLALPSQWRVQKLDIPLVTIQINSGLVTTYPYYICQHTSVLSSFLSQLLGLSTSLPSPSPPPTQHQDVVAHVVASWSRFLNCSELFEYDIMSSQLASSPYEALVQTERRIYQVMDQIYQSIQ